MERMIAMLRSSFVAAILCLVSFLAVVRANALEVGVARCDITPDVMGHKVPLAGYGARPAGGEGAPRVSRRGSRLDEPAAFHAEPSGSRSEQPPRLDARRAGVGP